jgi:hypothetical protein
VVDEMGHRADHHNHQHHRLLHLDPSPYRPACKPKVSVIIFPRLRDDCAFSSNPNNYSYVTINKYWDRISKVLILIVDAGLNWFFIRTVKTRLLKQYGLAKYKPLVKFNGMLMLLSILMDVSGPLPMSREDRALTNSTTGDAHRPHVSS